MSAAVVDLHRALAIKREKRRDTFRTFAALQGWAAYPTIDDHGNAAWLLTKGPRTIEFPSTESGEAFLDSEARS